MRPASTLLLSSVMSAALLCSACSHAQPQPSASHRHLSREVNAALADPHLPVRKYRGNRSGWTTRFETCISTPNPYAQDHARDCISEEIAGSLAAINASFAYLEQMRGPQPVVYRDKARQQHQDWLATHSTPCPEDNAGPAPYARQKCLLDVIDDYREQLWQQQNSLVPQRSATAVEAPPTAHGVAHLTLGDGRITVAVDDCPGIKSALFRACQNVRLELETPGSARREVLLPQVVFSDDHDDASAHRGTLEQGFSQGKYSLMLLDLNNDGNDDLIVWSGFDGNYGDPSYSYFLYDPATGRFVENTAIQALITMHSLSRIVDGHLQFWYRSGPCERGEKILRFDGQTPRIVEHSDHTDCSADPGNH